MRANQVPPDLIALEQQRGAPEPWTFFCAASKVRPVVCSRPFRARGYQQPFFFNKFATAFLTLAAMFWAAGGGFCICTELEVTAANENSAFLLVLV